MRHMTIAILLGTLLLLSGCGGGAGAITPPAETVSGVAAAGAVIVGSVTLKDSANPPRVLTNSGVNGSFSFDVTGLTKPFMLRASGTANARSYTLYSLASDRGIANLNPLANLVLAQAAGGADLAARFATPGASGFQDLAAGLGQALLDVQATLKPLLQKYLVSSVDPIKDPYLANGTGLDHMLDLVQIEIPAPGSVSISEVGANPVLMELASDFATHALSGAVTLSGAPFAGVTLSVTDTATGAISYGSALSAANGSYRIGNLPPGNYTVTPARTGYSFDRAHTTLTVAGSDADVPVFRSFLPLTVSGTVASANGSGLAGVTVSVQRDGAANAVSTVSDGAGRYSIAVTGNGNYTVSATRSYAPEAVSFSPPQVVSVSAAKNFGLADFSASQPSFTVSGKVAQLTGGQPMSGVALRLVTKNGAGVLLTDSAAIFTAVSDAAGNYSLSGIPPGYYGLTPVRTGYGFALLDVFATHGLTADNFSLSAANLQLDFSGRPASDANGGVTGF
jgi:hypothetical protein